MHIISLLFPIQHTDGDDTKETIKFNLILNKFVIIEQHEAMVRAPGGMAPL